MVDVRKTQGSADEISLKKALITLKNRLMTIIIITMLVFGAGCIYTFGVKVPLYESTASVILVDNSTKTTESLSLGKNLAASYAEIMSSRKVANLVIDDLDIDMEAADLQAELTVDSSPQTGVITATVTDEDPELAAKLANKIVEIFQKEIEENYEYTRMTIVDTAEVAREPYNVSYMKDMLVYLAVGFALALGIVFLIFYS